MAPLASELPSASSVPRVVDMSGTWSHEDDARLRQRLQLSGAPGSGANDDHEEDDDHEEKWKELFQEWVDNGEPKQAGAFQRPRLSL